ncbi:MAG: DUF4446 family protein [Microgenomates group bacterium]
MNNFLIFIVIFWLAGLTYFFLKLRNHYYRLISSSKKQNLDDILDWLLNNDKKNDQEIKLLKQKLEEEIKKSNFYFKKIGLVRFNPFSGGANDQSFVLALLDNLNNGIILNFIYTKEGLRVYTKRVNQGKGVEYQLSDEEKKAIENSQ